jgi:alpha-N-arabinofuranosidase
LDIAAGQLQQPAFVGRRLQHHDARFETRLQFNPIADGQRAGLLALIDENHFLFAGVEQLEGFDQFVIRRRATGADNSVGALIARYALSKSVSYQYDIALDFRSEKLTVLWRPAGSKKWRSAASDLDATFLASVNAGLFTGTVVGPHASSAKGQ